MSAVVALPWLAGAMLLLGGCAARAPTPAPGYVVLLPDPDGRIGQVLVQGQAGTQRIQRAMEGAALDGTRAPVPIDAARLERDFGAAMAARPALPEHFVLYFENADAVLTPESEARLAQVLERVAAREAADVSVIGHTDTVGTPERNEALAHQRAQAVADLLQARGLPPERLRVESHGEHNLLVPTPDETPEPRNRRVEVTVR